MVAFSASRLVCAAIAEIVPTTEPIRSAASFSEPITCWVRSSVGDGRLRHFQSVGGLLTDLLDRSGKLLCCGYRRVHTLRGLVGCRRSQSHAAECFVGDLLECFTGHCQRSGRFLDCLDHRADSGVEIGDRRIDCAPSLQRRLLGGLPVQRHGVGHVEADDLGYGLAAFGHSRRRKAVLARQNLDRHLHDETSRGAADAGVEPHLGFLLDRLPAGFGIVPIEPSA